MTDQALRDASLPVGTSPYSAVRPVTPTRFGEKVISFMPSRTEDEKPKGDGRTGSAQPRDWSAAVDLVREASEAIRISQERAGELEEQLDQVVAQATEEVQRLTAQIAQGEQKLGRAEERVRAAEARTAEAEAWLAQLHDAIFSAFGPRLSAEGKDPRAAHDTAGAESE